MSEICRNFASENASEGVGGWCCCHGKMTAALPARWGTKIGNSDENTYR